MTLHIRVAQITAQALSTTTNDNRSLQINFIPSDFTVTFPLTGTTFLIPTSEASFPILQTPQDFFIDFILKEQLTSNRSLALAKLRIPLSWISPDFVVRESFHLCPTANSVDYAFIFVDIHRNEANCEPFQRPFTMCVPHAQRIPAFSPHFEPNESDVKIIAHPAIQTYNCVLEDFDPEIIQPNYVTLVMDGLHILRDFEFFPAVAETRLRSLNPMIPISPDF
jgi:hypothetical protein